MPKPNQCKHCQEKATIHLTQIIGEKIVKIDICEKCPFKDAVTDPESFGLADMTGTVVPVSPKKTKGCRTCGFTLVQFKKNGRLGCPDCYETFTQELTPALKSMHKGLVHTGKIPETQLARVRGVRLAEDLRKRLEQAIHEENYEEAARLRDRIRSLQIG